VAALGDGADCLVQHNQAFKADTFATKTNQLRSRCTNYKILTSTSLLEEEWAFSLTSNSVACEVTLLRGEKIFPHAGVSQQQ